MISHQHQQVSGTNVSVRSQLFDDGSPHRDNVFYLNLSASGKRFVKLVNERRGYPDMSLMVESDLGVIKGFVSVIKDVKRIAAIGEAYRAIWYRHYKPELFSKRCFDISQHIATLLREERE